ncbi:hypothetical protein D3H55_02420 [Bacillus salacetis]|uniref:Uncharacterized protein n=1 Tax=Bacillus salacetis TaxID=2315464 RepID=A0A3A1RAJ1_9BACI|nr:hypothetical protein [Bacillus salacetis]RIW38411.1 hypothetical protein D3H55_02420 [Bacillus salacetis]
MSEERRRVINADKVLIRANEVIIMNENDGKRHRHDHNNDVAGAEDRRRKHKRDNVGGAENRRDDKHRGWSWF